MTIKKGELFRTTYSNQIYEVAGRWGCDLVLSPVSTKDEECFIYSILEIEELLEKGKLVRNERCSQ